MVSRVAKIPISVSSGVRIQIENLNVSVLGPLGELKMNIPSCVKICCENNHITVCAANTRREVDRMSGTVRSVLNNMIQGVSQGFSQELVLMGTGYRAKAENQNVLFLSVGFSRPVTLTMPHGVRVDTPTQTSVLLKGCDKQLVMQVAANIRNVRPPEPYKGKGIRYLNETVNLKEVKKK